VVVGRRWWGPRLLGVARSIAPRGFERIALVKASVELVGRWVPGKRLVRRPGFEVCSLVSFIIDILLDFV